MSDLNPIPANAQIGNEMHRLALITGEVRDHQQRLMATAYALGPASLPDHELLEVLLRIGSHRRDTAKIAKDLIDAFGDLPSVLSAQSQRVAKIATKDAAVTLSAISEAAQRLTRRQVEDQPVISCWDALISYCRAQMAYLTYEVFHVLFLDRANRLIADERLGKGTVDHVPVYPREILKRALELDACALILVHNHPSGDPSPSDTDVAMTQMIQTAAESLSITLHDHVIIGASGEISMSAEGLI